MSDAAYYRKKPVEVVARRFEGDVFEPIIADDYGLFIETPDGDLAVVVVGDYIIRDVNGTFYPCKPDIFAKTYTGPLATLHPPTWPEGTNFPDEIVQAPASYVCGNSACPICGKPGQP